MTNLNKAAATSTTIDVNVGLADTILNVQEHIASTTMTSSFPDQKLLVNGKPQPKSQRLAECGVKDGDTIEFVFQGSEQILVKQLSDLVDKKSVSPEELGFLYSYRYSVSFENALKALGYSDGKLSSFLENQKSFSLQGGQVKLVHISETAQTTASLDTIKEDKVHRLIEVSVSLEMRVAHKSPEALSHEEDEDAFLHLQSSDTVAKAKEIIAASEQVPFLERDLLMGGQKLDDKLTLEDAGVKNGSSLLMVVHASESSLASQLEGLLSERIGLSSSELGLHYCNRFGTPVGQALRTLGLHSSLARFLEGQPQFAISGGCVTLAKGPKLVVPVAEEEC